MSEGYKQAEASAMGDWMGDADIIITTGTVSRVRVVEGVLCVQIATEVV